MLNWRHEPYCWVPRIGKVCAATYQGLSLEGRALVTYLAKLADADGVVRTADGDPYAGLTRLIGVHLSERAAFRSVVNEVFAVQKRLASNEKTVVLPLYKTWQSSLEPRARLFLRESSTFAALTAFPRMYASEFIRTADDHGVVGASIEEMADRLSNDKAALSRNSRRDAYKADIAARVEKLVKEGFLVIDDGVRIKNFTAAQSTRADRDAATSGTLDRRPTDARTTADGRSTDGPHETSARNHSTQLGVSNSLPPSPQTAEETPTVSLRSAEVVAHAPTQNDPTRVVPVVPPTAHTGGESRVTTLRLVPDAATPPVAPQRPTHTSMNPHHGASMQPSLFADPSQPTTAHATPSEATDAPEPAPTPRSARKATPSGEKAPKVKAPPKEKKVRGPHPSVTLACVQVLADAAGDRFAMGSKWSDGVWRNLARCALKFPDVAEWKLVGEMLAAHGDGHYDMIGVNRVTDGWFTGSLAIAEKWVANGRQSRRSGPFVAKTNAAPSIPEGHRRYAPSAAQRLANATGKAVNSKMPTTFDDDDRDYDLSAPDCPVSLAR